MYVIFVYSHNLICRLLNHTIALSQIYMLMRRSDRLIYFKTNLINQIKISLDIAQSCNIYEMLVRYVRCRFIKTI